MSKKKGGGGSSGGGGGAPPPPPPPDTQPPTQPIIEDSFTTTDTTASITWTQSTDNVGVTGYKIYREGTHIATVTQRQYVYTGLTPGTTNLLGVSAIDAAGNESPIYTVSATTQQPPSPTDDPRLAIPPIQVVVNGQPLNYTPTVLSGTVNSFTATGLPPGANEIDTATGALSGTLTTNGRYLTQITGTNTTSGKAHTVLCLVVVVASKTVIDTAWLTANGPAPYWLTGSHKAYQLTADVSVNKQAFVFAGTNLCVYGDGTQTVTYNNNGTNGSTSTGVYGFHNFTATWTSDDSGQGFTTPPGGSAEARDCTVAGLIVRQGAAGTYSSGVGGYRLNNCINLDNSMRCAGNDSTNVFSRWGGPVRVYRCYCKSLATGYANRHANPSNLRGAETQCIIEDCVIEGGNSSVFCGNNSVIRRCVMRQDMRVTNGYAVNVYVKTGVLVENCVVIPIDGRGVLWNGATGGAPPVTPMTIRNNVMCALNKPNAEFGLNLQAACLRARYHFLNLTCEDNHFMAIGGGSYADCMPIFVGCQVTTPQSPVNNIIQRNKAYAVHAGSGLTFPGNAACSVYWANSHRGETVVSRNNELFSNRWLVAVNYQDGMALGARHESDKFRFANGQTAYDDFVAAVDSKLLSLRTIESSTLLRTNRDTLWNAAKTQYSTAIASVPLREQKLILDNAAVDGNQLVQFASPDWTITFGISQVSPTSYARSGQRRFSQGTMSGSTFNETLAFGRAVGDAGETYIQLFP